MTLPLLISVPHAGLWVPPEAEPYCRLMKHEILEDGDVGAAEIFWGLEPEVAAFLTTDVARAIVDLNRAQDDMRPDGVVKSLTCWNRPVYREPLPEPIRSALLEKYYVSYHRRLSELAHSDVRLGVDCHTMAVAGPPVGPDTGKERPLLCLSNGDGTCSDDWLESLAACLEESFGEAVALNHPFKGGFITRSHATELPWVQLELSRAPFLPNDEKGKRVLGSLKDWCAGLGSGNG